MVGDPVALKLELALELESVSLEAEQLDESSSVSADSETTEPSAVVGRVEKANDGAVLTVSEPSRLDVSSSRLFFRTPLMVQS